MWNNALYIYVLWMNLKIEMLILVCSVQHYCILVLLFYHITLSTLKYYKLIKNII